MKKIIFALFCFFLMLSSCKDSTNEIGLDIKPDEDEISVHIDTAHIRTSTYRPEGIFVNNNLFLLGEYTDNEYGTVNSSLLAQFIYPQKNMTFPEGSELDSMFLHVHYLSQFVANGDVENVNFKIYKLNNTLQYREKYYSNIDVSLYTDVNDADLLLGEINLTKEALSSGDTLAVDSFFRLNLDTELAKKFISEQSIYNSETDFFNFFGGVYIAAESGNRIIYVDSVRLTLGYSYPAVVNERDTTLHSRVHYLSNGAVRQVSSITHKNMDYVLSQKPDSVEYIFAPAGFFTKADVPIGKLLYDAIKEDVGEKKIGMNAVRLKVEGTRLRTDTITVSPPSYMLLIHADSVKAFFEQTNSLPNSYSSFYAPISTDTVIPYYNKYTYTFDLTHYVQKRVTETENKINNGEISLTDIDITELDNMVLIPIRASFSNSSLTAVQNASTAISGVTIKNSKSATPMKLDIMYSKFERWEK